MAGEQSPGGGLVATGPHHLDGRRGQTERAGETGGGDEVPLVPGDDAGKVMVLGQRPAAGEQRCRVAQIDHGVVDDERLLPRRLGAGEQDDVVRGGHLLQAVAAVGLVARRNDEHERTSGQEGVLRIGGRRDDGREGCLRRHGGGAVRTPQPSEGVR